MQAWAEEREAEMSPAGQQALEHQLSHSESWEEQEHQEEVRWKWTERKIYLKHSGGAARSIPAQHCVHVGLPSPVLRLPVLGERIPLCSVQEGDEPSQLRCSAAVTQQC